MSRKTISIALAILVFSSFALSQSMNVQPVGTTTTISVSPKEGALTAGSTLTLTAAVVAQGAPVSRGVVVFCEASARHCADLAVLGTAQLTRNGTASVRLTPGVGVYAIRAVYRGTPRTNPAVLASVSPLKRITVNPNVSTPTAKVATVHATRSK